MLIKIKRKSALIIIVSMLLNFFIFSNVLAAPGPSSRDELYDAAQKTVNYYYETFKDKEFAGILDWPALGLFGLGENVSGGKWTIDGKNGAYWREKEIKQGIRLWKTKNTDYQRTIIGICASGKDPRNFGDMNFVEIEKSTMMSNGHFADSVADNNTGLPVGDDLVNAHIFGIIALHCAGEPIPNRDKCLEWLENQQHSDGGFTWDVKYFDDPADYELIDSDVDMTAAALMGFAILGEDEGNSCVKRALEFIHEKQLDNGGFYSWGTENPESCAWVIMALTLLGQDPMGKEWTKPSGQNPVSALLEFQLEDGSFTHVLNEDDMLPVYENGMSTEQALYGMASAYNNKCVYDMLYEKYRPQAEENLFSDYGSGQFGFKETMELVYDYVLSGTNGKFMPESAVTREEFTKYVVYGLHMKDEINKYKGSDIFEDVNKDSWADGCIGVCAEKGFVNGNSNSQFSPRGSITGEELMTILIRCAGLESKAVSLQENGGEWSSGYIKLAEELGFTYDGFEEKIPVTRAQCSWSIVKLRDYLGIN